MPLFLLSSLVLAQQTSLVTEIDTCACFSNVEGGQDIRYCGINCGNSNCPANGAACATDAEVISQIRWGGSATSDPYEVSGLGFTGIPPTNITLDRDFYIGKLTHFNNPVYGAAGGVRIRISLNIPQFEVSEEFTFRMDIDETLNSANHVSECPYDSTVPCSDKITFDFAGFDSSSSFVINEVNYTLQLLGFKESQNSQSLPVTDFVSNERLTNQAYLFGKIVAACPDSCATGGDVQIVENPDGSFGCGCDCSAVTCADHLELRNDCSCVCPNELCNGYPTDINNMCACTCPSPDTPCEGPKSHWDTDACECVCPPDVCGAGFLTNADTCSCSCNSVDCGALTADPEDACTCKCEKVCGPEQVRDDMACTCGCVGDGGCDAGFIWEINPEDPLDCQCRCEDLCGGACNAGGEEECIVGPSEPCCAACKWQPDQTCDDGYFCTINDKCVAAEDGSYGCAGVPKCPDPQDTCTVFTCNPMDGSCIEDREADGAPCGDLGSNPEDWDRCAKECRDGICVDKAPVDCGVAPITSCYGYFCNPATGGCDERVVPDKPCNDENLCTTDDKCDANGVCAGTPNDCSDEDPIQCYSYSCNPLLGVCESRPDPSGSPCESAGDDLCLGEGTCAGGVCVFAPKCPPLTGDDGLCKINQCVSETGECIQINREDGSRCVTASGFAKEDELCTANFTCTSGVCGGADTGECRDMQVVGDAGEQNEQTLGVIVAVGVVVLILLALGLWALVSSQKLLDPSTWENMDQAALQSNPLFEVGENEGTNALFVG